ncbi:MAG: SUMF1/EgtB/PvdO family nonheme iron enzyme [bacterium]
METRNILRIVLSSPGDVDDERRVMENVIDELNRGIADDRNLRLELTQWETDTYPGFHIDGPQGLIDPILNIKNCDILLGIFWKRFGTPTKDTLSGTEYEFRTAHKSWNNSGRPWIMMYFKNAKPDLRTAKESEQYTLVLKFKEEFPNQGLYWTFEDTQEFATLAHRHLTKYLLEHFPAKQATWIATSPLNRELSFIREYCQNLQQKFSTILLFGDKRSRATDQATVNARMADVQQGFVPLHLKEWQDEDRKRETQALNIDTLFFSTQPRRLFLIRGLPGSGKTTLLRYLTYRFASLGATDNKKLTPVYLRCKTLNLSETTLEKLICDQINHESDSKEMLDALCAPSHFLEKSMVLLFDGLDEIEHAETGKHFAVALGKLATQHPRCKIIVSSRPIGLKSEDFPEFYALDLLPLEQEIRDDYLRKWFADDANKTEKLQEMFAAKPRILALAANPFLLSMICYTYEAGGDAALIERRSELYRNCTIALLRRAYDPESKIQARNDYESTLAVLKDLSLRFFLWQEADFPVDHVNVIGQRLITSEVLGSTEDFLDRVQRDTGLLQRDKDGFTFVHRSLWEYFTALALLDKESDFVIRHAANPDWEEVVRLYAGLLQKDESVAELVNGLWNLNRPLALRVTTEVKTPAAELIKPLIKKEEGNQSKLLLIDALGQSLPLIPAAERPTLVHETLAILLIGCEERDCEVIYHAQQLLEKLDMQPLEPGGLIHDLFDLENAAERQRELLHDSANHFECIEVEGGEFWMGDKEHIDNEKPAHRVRVDSFRMAKHPVTNRLLSSFPFGEKYPSYGGESHPAIGNNWWEAYYFALWIGTSLPTEAEWEYAARGGKHSQRTQFYFGDEVEVLPNHAWFGEAIRPHAHAVDEVNPRTGQLNLNPLGLANILGNVWEWCQDWYSDYRVSENANEALENPVGPKSGTSKIRRGGGFMNAADALRCARRYDVLPFGRDVVNGFRLVSRES